MFHCRISQSDLLCQSLMWRPSVYFAIGPLGQSIKQILTSKSPKCNAAHMFCWALLWIRYIFPLYNNLIFVSGKYYECATTTCIIKNLIWSYKKKYFLFRIPSDVIFLSVSSVTNARKCQPVQQRFHLHLHLHIEADTKLPPFSGRQFEIDFLQWKCLNIE